jgi:hypothetical protein
MSFEEISEYCVAHLGSLGWLHVARTPTVTLQTADKGIQPMLGYGAECLSVEFLLQVFLVVVMEMIIRSVPQDL